MPRSGYVAELRRSIGSRLLLLPSVTICIFDDQRRLLLARHVDSGLWSTPGGAIEPGETPAEAAVREAHEELGVEVRPQSLIGVFGGADYEVVYPNGDRVSYVTMAFECAHTDGLLEPDQRELTELVYVGRDDGWRELAMPAWLPHALPRLLAWPATGRLAAHFDGP
jgi:8-oxo-dGTP pyrophosphatase MutT (NUDIX family)